MYSSSDVELVCGISIEVVTIDPERRNLWQRWHVHSIYKCLLMTFLDLQIFTSLKLCSGFGLVKKDIWVTLVTPRIALIYESGSRTVPTQGPCI